MWVRTGYFHKKQKVYFEECCNRVSSVRNSVPLLLKNKKNKVIAWKTSLVGRLLRQVEAWSVTYLASDLKESGGRHLHCAFFGKRWENVWAECNITHAGLRIIRSEEGENSVLHPSHEVEYNSKHEAIK